MLLAASSICSELTDVASSPDGDLHPGNIMVKFYRPTTGTLLRSAWNYLRHNLSSSSPSSSSPQAATESDDVVARMLSVKHNPEQWLVELRTLFDKGYRPELVFIDAGLVTCLSDTNRRNFLDLSVNLPVLLLSLGEG